MDGSSDTTRFTENPGPAQGRATRPSRARGIGTGWLLSLALHGALLIAAGRYVAQRAAEAEAERDEVVTMLDLRPMGLVTREEVATETRPAARDAVPRPAEPPLFALEQAPRDLAALFVDGETEVASTNVVSASGAGQAAGPALHGTKLARRVVVAGSAASGQMGGAPSGTGGSTGTSTGGVEGTPSGGASGALLVPPTIVSSPAIAYPASARRRVLEGDVRCRLHVTAEGRVESVDITLSSGHAVLDEAAQHALLDWRFTPATRGGVPCACVIEHVVTFRLVGAATERR